MEDQAKVIVSGLKIRKDGAVDPLHLPRLFRHTSKRRPASQLMNETDSQTVELIGLLQESILAREIKGFLELLLQLPEHLLGSVDKLDRGGTNGELDMELGI
jgi:hypothetical protein